MQASFHAILSDQLVIDGATDQLNRLRFLCLKNLASLVSSSPHRSLQSLSLYARAVEEDDTDVALWDKFGSLAATIGEWAIAKHAFEQVLLRDPHHPTVIPKLLQLTSHIGDNSMKNALLHINSSSLAFTYPKKKKNANVMAPPLLKLPVTNTPLSHHQGPVFCYGYGDGDNSNTQMQCVDLDDARTNANGAFFRLCQLLAREVAQSNSTSTTKMMRFTSRSGADVVQVQEEREEELSSDETDDGSGDGDGAVVEQEKEKEKEGEDNEGGQEKEQEKEKEGEEEVQPPPSVQRRSSRTTRGRHSNALESSSVGAGAKSLGGMMEGAAGTIVGGMDGIAIATGTGTGTYTDAVYVDWLRDLGSTMPTPHRPDSAQLATASAKSGKKGGQQEQQEGDGDGGKDRMSVEEEKEMVLRMGVHLVPTPTSAPALALQFIHYLLLNDSVLACIPRLRHRTSFLSSFVSLVINVEKYHQWRGEELSAAQCLILAELCADNASRRHAMSSSSAISTTMSSLEKKEHSSAKTGLVWLARYKAASLGSIPTNKTSTMSVRYWWARGRLLESCGDALSAVQCYRLCNTALLEASADVAMSPTPTTPIPITLLHCSWSDVATISPASIASKLELLQLHDVMMVAQRCTHEDKYKEALDVLVPVVLPCSEKEVLMANVDGATWLLALRTLMQCAGRVKDDVINFRCLVRLLRARMPRTVPIVQHSISTGSSHGGGWGAENNKEEKDDQGSTIHDVATDASMAASLLIDIVPRILYSNTPTPSHPPPGETLHPFERHVLSHAITQCLSLVYTTTTTLRAYPPSERRSTLNNRTTMLRQAASDGAVIALQLWALQSYYSAPTASSTTNNALCMNKEHLVTWGYTLCDVLGEAGALHERRCAVAAALKPHLVAALATGEASGEGEGDEDVVEELECGLHHCILWLHGLRLCGIDYDSWGGGGDTLGATTTAVPPLTSSITTTTAQPTPWGGAVRGLRPLNTKDDVLALWPLVSEDLSALSVTALSKQSTVMNSIFALFSSLPQTLQSRIDRVWEGMAGTGPPHIDDRELHNPFEPIVRDLEREREEGQEGEEWQRYLPVYRSLFLLKFRMQPVLESFVEAYVAQCAPSSTAHALWLSPGVDAAVIAYHAPLLLHLTFNPTQHPDGWSELSLSYYKVLDLVLTEAAQEIPARRWPYAVDLRDRVQRYRRIAAWCISINALYISEDEDKANILELLASKEYESTANAPPLGDQLRAPTSTITTTTTTPQQLDEDKKRATKYALDAYTQAAEILSDEWIFRMHQGRCQRRLDPLHPHTWLPVLAHACHLASKQTVLPVDPYYTLHAARLRLLHSSLECTPSTAKAKVKATGSGRRTAAPSNVQKNVVELLQLIGMYCFRKESQAVVQGILPPQAPARVSAQEVEQCVKELKADAEAALEWCCDKEKMFHRAATMLAQMRTSEGEYAAAVSLLSPLFSKGPRAPFTVNMWPMMDTVVGLASSNGAGGGGGDGGGRKKRGRKRKGGGGGWVRPSQEQQEEEEGDDNNNNDDDDNDNDQETSFGLCPITSQNRPCGSAFIEPTTIYYGRLRKALVLYLNAVYRTGATDTLAAASSFFTQTAKAHKEFTFLTRPGFEDVREVAQGMLVLSALREAMESVCPLNDALPPSGNGGGRSGGSSGSSSPSKSHAKAQALSEHHRHLRHLATALAQKHKHGGGEREVVEKVLSHCYTLWVDHTVLSATATATAPGGGSNEEQQHHVWTSRIFRPARFVVSTGLLGVEDGASASEQRQQQQQQKENEATSLLMTTLFSARSTPETSELAFSSYAYLYLHYLAVCGGSEKIKSIVLALKKRYRSLSSADPDVRPMLIVVACCGMDAVHAECKQIIDAAKLVLHGSGSGSGGSGGGLPPQPALTTDPFTPEQMALFQGMAYQQGNMATQQQVMALTLQNNAPPPLTLQQAIANANYHHALQSILEQARKQREVDYNQALEQWNAMVVHAQRFTAPLQPHLPGPPTPHPPSPQEEQVITTMVGCLNKIVGYMKAVGSWMNGSMGEEESGPGLVRAKVGTVEDVKVGAVEVYLDAVHVGVGVEHRPTTRSGLLKLGDDIVKHVSSVVIGGGRKRGGGAVGIATAPSPLSPGVDPRGSVDDRTTSTTTPTATTTATATKRQRTNP